MWNYLALVVHFSFCFKSSSNFDLSLFGFSWRDNDCFFNPHTPIRSDIDALFLKRDLGRSRCLANLARLTFTGIWTTSRMLKLFTVSLIEITLEHIYTKLYWLLEATKITYQQFSTLSPLQSLLVLSLWSLKLFIIIAYLWCRSHQAISMTERCEKSETLTRPWPWEGLHLE